MENAYLATAEELYRELDADMTQPDVRRSYRVMLGVLHRGVEPFTQHAHLKHPSLFAKLNYMLGERKAHATLRQRINGARSRMRRAATLPIDLLAAHRQADCDAVRACIALFYGEEETSLSLDETAVQPEVVAAPVSDLRTLRISVTSFDEGTVTGRMDADTDATVTAVYSDRNPFLYHRDWSYLHKILREGAQLNLVRCHLREDGVLLPELFVVEPDILMDITSVAGCIESYAESPLVHLIGRISPNETTAPILLGNFASQLLDETIHGIVRPYAESASDFLHANALLLASTSLSDTFHADALQQQTNIRRCVGEALPQHFSRFCSADVVLEPTFFCETLGLQGRMDMLQLDGHILVEQKSGKGGWPNPPDPEMPLQQQKHYAQVLLYMAVLHYGMGIPNEDIAPFLLYSKYAKGLLNLGPAPDLLHLALRLRNQMARCEQIYAEEGYSVLTALTPDRLRLKRGSDRLWYEYKRPELEALLRPIQDSTSLERAYYLRYLRFLSAEHLLSKVGNAHKDCSGFAAKWQCSLDEKHVAGNILDSLHLAAPADASATQVEEVRLLLPSSVGPSEPGVSSSNFRKGDIVVLYPYAPGSEPDVRRAACLRGSLSEITTESITVRLRAPQTTARYFYGATPQLWAVEHDFYESSSSALFRGLHAFLSAPKERRDLILAQRRPEVDDTLSLRGDYGAFNDLALRVHQSRDFFLIIGPPGTGKTSFGLMTTLQEELLSPESTVLVLSYTNRAVDEACSKLVEAGIDFVRIGGSLTCSEECRPHLLEERTASMRTADEVRQLITTTRVFAATTAALCGHQELFRLRKFSLAIIDEASQILEPQILPILSAVSPDGTPAVQRFVMIGDHKQLPAVVQQSEAEAVVDDALLQGIGLHDCRSSLFERLLRTYRQDSSVVYMLTRQGRMHPAVAEFANQQFYGGMLTDAGRPHQLEPTASSRVRFYDVPAPESSPSDKVNEAEASVIARLVAEYMEEGYSPDEIGIIVPYRNQISAVSAQLATLPGTPTIVTDTVERFQGSQRRVIIYGFTVQRRYQLNFLTSHTFEEDGTLIDRKLNVALTRAMEHIALVGNAALLREAPVFRQLLSQYLETCS